MKEIEHEFNCIFAPGKKKWRCTARSISPMQFVMRFPNASEVERACCYGKRLPLKDGSIIVCITPWSASVGAKGSIEKEWVRVINIPLEKRCSEHVAYAGGLVGITLEVDEATLHKPEYARILLGCREVKKIPPSAEGMLGEQFYDFFYEVEQVLFRDPNHEKHEISVSPNPDGGNPKKSMQDVTPGAQMGSSLTGLGGKSLPNP